MPHLNIQNGGGPSITHELNGGTVSIGRDAENTIVLDNESVSSRHAEVEHTDGRYVLRDLGSSNGTKVNEVSVQTVELKDGDRIAFGPVEAAFVTDQPAIGAECDSSTDAGKAADERTPEIHSLGTSLRRLGRALWGETKRGARLAGLKAKIEKLRAVDLNAAYYSLGKHSYELNLFGKDHPQLFEEIATLNKAIHENTAATPSTESATTSARLRQIGSKAAAKAEAAALGLKVKQLYVKLGRLLTEHNQDSPNLSGERAAVEAARTAIESAENAVQTLGADSQHSSELKQASRSAAEDARRGGALLIHIVRRFPKTSGLAFIGLILIVILAGGSGKPRLKIQYAPSELNIEGLDPLTVKAVYANAGAYFDKPVVVQGIITASGGYGLEYEHEDENYFAFTITADPRGEETLKAYLKRSAGPALYDAVIKTGENGMKGTFVVSINRHTKDALGYAFKNSFWTYAQCELLAYGGSVEAIRGSLVKHTTHDRMSSHSRGNPKATHFAWDQFVGALDRMKQTMDVWQIDQINRALTASGGGDPTDFMTGMKRYSDRDVVRLVSATAANIRAIPQIGIDSEFGQFVNDSANRIEKFAKGMEKLNERARNTEDPSILSDFQSAVLEIQSLALDFENMRKSLAAAYGGEFRDFDQQHH